MSNEKVAQISQIVDASTEPKASAEWQQKVLDYDTTLSGTLEPEIRKAIEALRVHAIQQTFLSEITAPPVNVDAPAQQFVTPRVPDTMPVSVAESIKTAEASIAQIENSLQHNPPHHFVAAYRDLLAEARKRREKIIFDFHNPAPLPIPLPAPPIKLPPEVIALVRQIIREESPSIIAQTIAWFRANPEWMRS